MHLQATRLSFRKICIGLFIGRSAETQTRRSKDFETRQLTIACFRRIHGPSSLQFCIPAYNEARRLPATLAAIAEFTASRRLRCEIVVADDGSTDSMPTSPAIFALTTAESAFSALRTAAKDSQSARHLLGARQDELFCATPICTDQLVKSSASKRAIRRGADIAIGSRSLKPFHCVPDSRYRCISSRLFNLLTGGILGLPTRTRRMRAESTYPTGSRTILPLLRLDGWGYDSELIHVALTLDLRVEEVGFGFCTSTAIPTSDQSPMAGPRSSNCSRFAGTTCEVHMGGAVRGLSPHCRA